MEVIPAPVPALHPLLWDKDKAPGGYSDDMNGNQLGRPPNPPADCAASSARPIIAASYLRN